MFYLVVYQRRRWSYDGKPLTNTFQFSTEEALYAFLKYWERHIDSFMLILPVEGVTKQCSFSSVTSTGL